jgi:hypothetical protein
MNEIENESHFLYTCSLNEDIRNDLLTKTKSIITDHNHIEQLQLIQREFIRLTNPMNELLASVTFEHQAHLTVPDYRKIHFHKPPKS